MGRNSRYEEVPSATTLLESQASMESGTRDSPVVSVDNVTFSYGSHRALDDFTLQLLPGEVTGLLGHNGAGKTTAIKLVNGLFRPHQGSVRVFGADPAEEKSAVRRRMAVVTDTLGLSDRESPNRALRYHANLYGYDVRETLEAGGNWGRRFGIYDHFDKPVKTLSRGMKQRFALCRALSGNPDVLLLDEPTLGMDPVARQDFRTMLDEFRGLGGTVLMSTHDLGEVERSCQQVVVLQHGKIVTSGSTQDFMRPLMRDLDVEIEFEEVTAALVESLHVLGSVRDIKSHSNKISFQAREREAIADSVRTLVLAGARIIRIGSTMPTLEDAYLTLHGAPLA